MAEFQQSRKIEIDRLNRRLSNYRNHSTVSNRHFEATVDAIYTDQHKKTILLKQRHIESKVKKNAKKSETKKQESSNLIGQSKLLSRSHDQTAVSADIQENEPAAKKQRITNESLLSSSVGPDISNFQIVQQLHQIKNSNSPNQIGCTSNSTETSKSVPNLQVSNLACPDAFDILSDTKAEADTDESIKKENEIDLPNDSLLDDFGEISNFEDIDMGINLEDFVHDLDLDNIKHENSNPGIDSFFKEEIVDNLFDDQTTDVPNDIAGGNSSGGSQTNNRNLVSSVPSTTGYPQYSNTSQVTMSSIQSFPSCSYSSPTSQSYVCSSSSSTTAPFAITKMRPNTGNINMGVNDMSLAAQTLKQMAEQHQTKISPTGGAVRTNISDFNNYSMPVASSSVVTQSSPVTSQIYHNQTNQTNTQYGHHMGNDMELKRRQQVLQQFPQYQQIHHPQSTPVRISQPNVTVHVPNIQQRQPHHQQKQNQQQTQSQVQEPQELQMQNQQEFQQTDQDQQQATPQHQSLHQQQQNLQHQPQRMHIQQKSLQQQAPQHHAPLMQQQTTQQQSQVQQQHVHPMSQLPQTMQQGNAQPQIGNRVSPFSNRMSPVSPFNHNSQNHSPIGMNVQFSNAVCNEMPNNANRSSYPSPQRGLSPNPSGSQSQPNMPVPNGGNQSIYIQHQMVNSSGMIRPQLISHQGQIMSRPPPPEYRHPAMVQQHQTLINQQQNMPQLSQGYGHMQYPGLRPGYRPALGGNTIAAGRMAVGQNQQNIPANSFKGCVGQPGGMIVSVGSSAGQNTIVPSGSIQTNIGAVSVNQADASGNMNLVNTRPTLMHRLRAPNVNYVMNTQVPPSRPEWRQMIQQNQGGIVINPGIRHGYQLAHQNTGMLAQQGSVMPMQRPQRHVIGMAGGIQNVHVMQQSTNMNNNSAVQGNTSIPVSNNSTVMQSMPLMGRVQQQGVQHMGQGQRQMIHLGIQHQQESRSDANMPAQNHIMIPTSVPSIGTPPSSSLESYSGACRPNSQPGENSNFTSMACINVNSRSHLDHSTNVASSTQPQNQNNVSGVGLTGHPKSSMGQMHSCSSPVNVSGIQQRRIVNPNMTSTSQGHNVSSTQMFGNAPSSLLECAAPSGIMPQKNQTRQPTDEGVTPGRNLQNQNLETQNLNILPQNASLNVQNQPARQSGTNIMQVTPGLINKTGNNAGSGAAARKVPDNRGGVAAKAAEPAATVSSLSSNDFDLMFGEGEFAALLN